MYYTFHQETDRALVLTLCLIDHQHGSEDLAPGNRRWSDLMQGVQALPPGR
jgi:hypothetical protein